MADTIHYGCTALIGTNKAGVLKPDADGRYDMILGALEYPNSVGDIYTLKSAQEFFKEGSALRRRIENGQLRAEMGHPKQVPGMDDKMYLERILTIEETNVCAHISDIYIDMSSVKDPKTGKTIITIRGKVKPSGPKGQYLKEMLDDPKQNIAFSVRSLTMNRMVGFRRHKDFTQIVTWDYVNEPGLAPANKYQVPTLESASFDIKQIEEMCRTMNSNISMESLTLLRDTLSNAKVNRTTSKDW